MFKKFKTKEGEVFEAFRCKKKNIRKILDMSIEGLSEKRVQLIIDLTALFCGCYDGLPVDKGYWVVIKNDDDFCLYGHNLFKNKFKLKERKETRKIQYTGKNYPEVLDFFYPDGLDKEEYERFQEYIETFVKEGDWLLTGNERNGYVEIYTKVKK